MIDMEVKAYAVALLASALVDDAVLGAKKGSE